MMYLHILALSCLVMHATNLCLRRRFSPDQIYQIPLTHGNSGPAVVGYRLSVIRVLAALVGHLVLLIHSKTGLALQLVKMSGIHQRTPPSALGQAMVVKVETLHGSGLKKLA